MIWADGAYAGDLQPQVRGMRKWGKLQMEIASRPLPEQYVSVSYSSHGENPATLMVPKRKQVGLTIENLHRPVPCPSPVIA